MNDLDLDMDLLSSPVPPERGSGGVLSLSIGGRESAVEGLLAIGNAGTNHHASFRADGAGRGNGSHRGVAMTATSKSSESMDAVVGTASERSNDSNDAEGLDYDELARMVESWVDELHAMNVQNSIALDDLVKMVNSRLDRLKESFLCAAARGGRLQECAGLLSLGAEVECAEGEEDTPLLAAIRNGHKDVAALLLAHGANPLQRDLEGNSVMHLAAANSDEGMASLLSPNAASLALSTNDDGMTAIDVAVQRGFNAFAEHLHNLLCGAEEEKDELPAALSIDGEDSANDESTVEDVSSPSDARDDTNTLLDEDAGDYGREGDVEEDASECSEEEDLEEVNDSGDGEDPNAVMNQLRHMTQLARSQSIELYQAKYALSEVMHERGEQEDETAALQHELAMVRGDDDVLAKMSLTELIALEEQVKCSLEKITKAKEMTSSNLEDERVCVICRENPKSVLLMNCRHLCVCAECSHLDILVQCPLCREPITERINVFA